MAVGILLDVILIVILALTLMIGIKKGFLAMARWLVSTVVMLVAVFYLTGPATDVLLSRVDWDKNLATAIAPASDKVFGLSQYNYTVLSFISEEDAELDENGEKLVGLIYRDNNNNRRPFHRLEQNAGAFQKMGLSIVREKAPKYLEDHPNQTVFLGNVLTNSLAVYIITTCMGLVLIIAFSIVIAVIFKLLSKLSKRIYIVYALDKILGAVMGLVFGVVILYVIVTVLLLLQNNSFMEPVNLGMQNSYLMRYVAQYDFLYRSLKDGTLLKFINEQIKKLLAGSAQTAKPGG